MINAVGNLYSYIGYIFSNKKIPKSKKGFRFWTFLKMSIFEKRKYFSKKRLQKTKRDDNAAETEKTAKKM